jgi:hypothetical protein
MWADSASSAKFRDVSLSLNYLDYLREAHLISVIFKNFCQQPTFIPWVSIYAMCKFAIGPSFDSI